MMTRCIVDVERDVGMKNLSPKEAITILEDMRINTSLPKAAVMQKKRNAAIDMAIDTLKYSEMPNSSDSISRQAALGVIKRKLAEPAYQHAGEDWYVDMNDAESELLELPSAQPEQRWIPCSERLPEESGRYLISALDGIGRRTTVAPYQPRYKAWTMTGRMAYWKVIAWQPLPEPYGGDNE